MSWRGALAGGLAILVAACSSTAAPTAPTTAPVDSLPSATTMELAPAGSTTTSSTQPEGVFADADALAAELSAVEAGIRRPELTDDDAAALGRRQQLAYRALNRHPDWITEVQRSVQPVAAVPLAFHLAARQAQVDHAAGRPPTEPPPTLPAWTIVAPLPIDELRGYYDEAEAATGVPWEYLAAINFQETRMGRVVGASSAGAIGPMQFLPTTWAACCTGDPTVPRDAILGAATYLAQHGAPADMHSALLQYNPNEGYVGAVTAYAMNLTADERALVGYHGWDVFYSTSAGTVRLPVGYTATEPIDAATYVRDHPEDLLPIS